MAINFDEDITARIARQRKQQMAATMGKTVEQMDEDSEYFDEIKAIDAEDKMGSEAEAARMMDAQGYMPPAKEPTVGGLEDLGRGALPVTQAESRMREREFGENQTPSLSPETGLTGESINPWDAGEAGQTGEYAIGHSPWSGPAEEPIGGGLEDLGKEAYSKGNVDTALERMRIREHEESQNSPSLSPETELTGESINPWNVNESSETGEYAIGHSPWSGPAEEPSVGGLEDLGKEAHSKGNVDKALERMRIREYEESQNSPSLTPEDPELAGVRTEGWLDSTTEEPMGMLDDLRAETQAGEFEGVERDENDPAVKEMKEVQNNPEARKEIFKDMSKEETAMAKEEYGNYYIGPGGYAINLNKLGERKEQFRREAKFSMLQYIPDHAKPQMLASWGFIDQEDVDASPDDPKVQEQKIKVAGALALQEMVKEGLISVANINSDGTFRNTKELTRSREEISKGQYQNNTDLATMNNAVKKEITGMGIEWNKVKLKADEVMHMDDNELKRWGIQFKGDMDMEQLHMVRDHFKKEMKFKYSKIRGIEKFQTAQLGQQGEQFKLTHGLKTTDQQQGWLVKQHTMMLQKAKQLLDNGNPTAAMMVYQAAGSDVEIDIPGYWKKQAKSSAFGNAKVGAAFSAMGFSTDNNNLNTGINGFVNEKKLIRKKYSDDTIDESTGMTKLDQWVENNQRNASFSADPLGPAWSVMTPDQQEAYPGGRPAWKAVTVSKALRYEMGLGEYKGVFRAMESGKIKITPKNNKKEEVKVPGGETAAVAQEVIPKVKTPAAKLKTQLSKLNKIFKGGTGKRSNVGGMVPKGDSVNSIFSYGQQAYSKDEWEKGPDAGSFSVAGAYGRQPDFMKTQKWSTKPQMYDYFLKNPEELKHIDGKVRTEIIKGIKKRTLDKLAKGL